MKKTIMAFKVAGRTLAMAAIFIIVTRAAFPADAPKDEPKSAWRSGPVKFILTSEEDKAYKGLKTDEDRASWIEAFWVKRDPTPGTPANEYRDDFYSRVGDANKEFREGTITGWMTDRGKLLIVAGYPDERIQDTSKETWVYARALPEAGGQIPPPKTWKVAFTKEEGQEEFRMSSAGDELIDALGALAPSQFVAQTISRTGGKEKPAGAVDKDAKQAADALARTLPPAQSPAAGASSGAASPAGAQPAPLALPAGVERLRTAALGTEPKAEITLATLPRYYKADDGSTRTLITVSIKKSEIGMGADNKPRTVIYARLVPQEAPEGFIEFIEQDLFTVYDDPAEGVYKYAFAWPLKRKTYDLKVAVSDGPEGKMATHTEVLTLPDFKGGNLTLSSITLARKAEPVVGEAAPEEGDNYRVGALRLIPCVNPVLTAGKDELNFFYDVYNAKLDPATNKPTLDVTYSFEQKTSAGWKKRGRLVEPDKHEEMLGYTIPADVLAQWPAADFRVTVQAKDKVANVEATSSVEFSIVK